MSNKSLMRFASVSDELIDVDSAPAELSASDNSNESSSNIFNQFSSFLRRLSMHNSSKDINQGK